LEPYWLISPAKLDTQQPDTIDLVEEGNVYSAIGDEGFERLVAAFYRQVPGDDVLGPLYPAHDLPGAEQRLRDFLIYRFGGPATYIEQRGHPRLRIRHAPFSIGEAARGRWLQLMNRALAEAMLPEDVTQVLSTFFASTAAFLMNRPG
jgi:hemoglobin